MHGQKLFQELLGFVGILSLKSRLRHPPMTLAFLNKEPDAAREDEHLKSKSSMYHFQSKITLLLVSNEFMGNCNVTE